ncbi:AGZA family xanthine/uracil permease-like MFS transporter [Rhizomicrobium palustre]|uniref:AGZA family xanthine/uracil permease-like MFS transporter n=1 Tax=Rhizomicrobium palustre TaxID=189966 RepID=A0A846N2W1_9PROT|nr:NCS2 family permease [Rhizomicrobium palustre]NIK89562.1 AGZA family xanthine/uracil permease-like MFS transporter [Rhizomicrobium palustre]
MFERFFQLSAHGTTLRREVIAGLTTFLTMAYIVVLNPTTLHSLGSLPYESVFVATCLAAALTTLMMGLYAKLPVALAPGMGLNAYFAYSVVPGLNMDWRLGFGCVFLSGILFVAISITPAREWLINAIPRSLKLSIAAGIGFFLAFIGLYNAGFVVSGHNGVPMMAGELNSPEVLLAGAGLVVIVALAHRRVIGAVLIFLLVEMLDASGTLTAVAYQANMLDEKGRIPNLRRALTTDAFGSMIGAVLGTSPLTAYIESAAGIQAGGRTGLTAVVVGLLFLLALFFSPLALAVPGFATAPALIFVAALMVKGLKEIHWDDLTEAAPALLTALAIPLTYSIATGIGIGFIAFVVLKLVAGRWRDLNWAVAIIAAAFAAKIAFNLGG